MSVFTKRAIDVFAPVDASGNPRGASMGETMVWGTELERATDGAEAGRVDQATWTGLDAIDGTRAGQPAIVYGPDAGTHTDPVTGATVPNEGQYYWSVTPEGWRRSGSIQRDLVHALNSGGTSNAVEAVSDGQFDTSPYRALITVNFTAANTGAMTLSITGETPRPLVTNTGEPIPAGYVSAGMSALVQIDGAGNYRLFSYGDAAAVQAVVEDLLLQAEAARDAAAGEADRAEGAATIASGAMTTLLDPQFATKTTAEAYTPIAAPDYIRTSGYAAAGDGGGALYKLVAAEPVHAGKFSITLSDGVTVAWYEIAEEFVRPEMFGAANDGATDATTAVQAAFASGFNVKMRKRSNYLVTAGLVLATAGQAIHWNGATVSSSGVAEKQLLDIQANDVELRGPGTIDGAGLPPIDEDFIGVTWNGMGVLSRGTSGDQRTGLYIGGGLKIRNCPGSAIALEYVSDGEINGVRTFNCDEGTTYDGPGVYLVNYMIDFTVSNVSGRDFNWKGWNQSNSSNFTLSGARFKNGKNDQCAIFHKGCTNFISSDLQVTNAFGVKCDKSTNFVISGLEVDCSNYGFGGLMVQGASRAVCTGIRVRDYTAYGIIHGGHPSTPATDATQCVYSDFSLELTGTPPNNRGAIQVQSYTNAIGRDVIFSNGYIKNCFYGLMIDATADLATDNVVFDNITIDTFVNAATIGAAKNTTWRNLKFRNGAENAYGIRLFTGGAVDAEKYIIEGCEGDNLDGSITFINAATTGSTGIRVKMLEMSRNKLVGGGRLINLALNNATDFIKVLVANGNASLGTLSATPIQLSNPASASAIQTCVTGNTLLTDAGAKATINFVEDAASGKFNGVVESNMAAVLNKPNNV